MVTLFAQAQEIYLGGGISLWHNTDLEKTSFSISPEIGYVFSEKWAVGAEIAYAHNSYEEHLRLLQMRLSLRRMLVFLSMKQDRAFVPRHGYGSFYHEGEGS